MPRCSRISKIGIQYTPVDSSATVVTPHCSSQSVKRSRSSVKVANTRTGFSSRPGGTATNISRAPTSIPAAFGSNTGRSSKHIPLFRLRRLGFASRACRLTPRVFFTGCSLSELQATAKLRNRRYSSKRNQLGHPTVNHCSAHGTWSHANDRRSTTHHCHNGLLPLPVAPSQNAEIPWPTQVPFRFAPTTGRVLR